MAVLPRRSWEVNVLDWLEAHAGALGVIGSLFVLPLIEYIRRQNKRLTAVEAACTANDTSVANLAKSHDEFKADTKRTVERIFAKTDRIDRGIARIAGHIGAAEEPDAEDENL